MSRSQGNSCGRLRVHWHALLLLMSCVLLQAEEFTVSHFGFGPIRVTTNLVLTPGEALLAATATNGTNEPINFLKLCIQAPGLKTCLFEMWTTAPLTPGGKVSWNVSARKPRGLRETVHEVTLLSLTRSDEAIRAQRLAERAARLMETDPSGAESTAREALALFSANSQAAHTLQLVLEKRVQAESDLVGAEQLIEAGRPDDAISKLKTLALWKTRFAARFQQAERKILAAKLKLGIAGDVDAQTWLAFAYISGDGVAIDAVEASRWYRKAADQGDPWAEVGLGRMYLQGRGVPLSNVEAARLFERAANQGYSEGQHLMALLCRAGLGVPQDYLRAHMWANLAASLGHADAITLRDSIAKLLPPDRLAAAQALAAAWTPSKVGASPSRATRRLEVFATGSSFSISSSGYMVTNYHVIEGCANVIVADGPIETVATVVANDPKTDLAILRVDRTFSTQAMIRQSPARLAEQVWAAGFPLNNVLRAFNITSGEVSSDSGFDGDSTRLQVTTPIQHGNSGGPLLTRDGAVAGVVVERLEGPSAPQNVNFAIKSSILKEFLDSNHAPYSLAKEPQSLDSTVLAEQARKFTFLVQCWR